MKKTPNILTAVGVTVILVAAALGFSHASKPRMPQTYAELTSLPAEKLGQINIALMNLLCAEGLPGAENLDVTECLAVLDRWAEVVNLNNSSTWIKKSEPVAVRHDAES